MKIIPHELTKQTQIRLFWKSDMAHPKASGRHWRSHYAKIGEKGRIEDEPEIQGKEQYGFDNRKDMNLMDTKGETKHRRPFPDRKRHEKVTPHLREGHRTFTRFFSELNVDLVPQINHFDTTFRGTKDEAVGYYFLLSSTLGRGEKK